jgi:Arc/MetJ family transcription regulator
MATNLALDDALIVEAQMIGHHKSKKDAVTAALTEYIQRHKQEEIIGLFGSVDFSPIYDYKAARKSR